MIKTYSVKMKSMALKRKVPGSTTSQQNQNQQLWKEQINYNLINITGCLM